MSVQSEYPRQYQCTTYSPGSPSILKRLTSASSGKWFTDANRCAETIHGYFSLAYATRLSSDSAAAG